MRERREAWAIRAKSGGFISVNGVTDDGLPPVLYRSREEAMDDREPESGERVVRVHIVTAPRKDRARGAGRGEGAG